MHNATLCHRKGLWLVPVAGGETGEQRQTTRHSATLDSSQEPV